MRASRSAPSRPPSTHSSSSGGDAAIQASVMGAPPTPLSVIQRARRRRCAKPWKQNIIMTSRRDFFKLWASQAALLRAGLGQPRGHGGIARAGDPDQPEHHAPLVPNLGRPYNPVVTLNGWTLPWRMNQGVWRVFWSPSLWCARWRLASGPSVGLQRPESRAHHRSGGRRSRSHFVTNKLPEHTSIHWHGQRLPNGMDGVAGLNQPDPVRARPSSTSSSRAARHLHVPPACGRDDPGWPWA